MSDRSSSVVSGYSFPNVLTLPALLLLAAGGSGACTGSPDAGLTPPTFSAATSGAGGDAGATAASSGGSIATGGANSPGGAPAAGGSLTESASANSGGNTGPSTGGTGGSTVDSAPPLEVTDLIDDLEDGNTSILASAGRTGQWYFYNSSGNNTPGSVAQVLDVMFPGATGSKFSIETKGGPLSGDDSQAYAGIAFDFDNPGNAPTDPSRMPYDVSAWDGISFWAKGNVPGQILRLELPTLEVTALDQHGTCTDSCNDSFGKELALTGEWSKYELPFSALTQEGWGAVKPLNLMAALGVNFEYGTPGGSFDFAIDDVALYRESGPSSPGQ